MQIKRLDRETHFTDFSTTDEDKMLGDELAVHLGDTLIHSETNSPEGQWTRVVKILRLHSLRISELYGTEKGLDLEKEEQLLRKRVKMEPPPSETWWAKKAQAFLTIAQKLSTDNWRFSTTLNVIAKSNTEIDANTLRKLAKSVLEKD